MPRVVVTGIGAVTPIGTAAAGLYAGIRRAQSAVARVTRFFPSPFYCPGGAPGGDLFPPPHMDAKRGKSPAPLAPIAGAAPPQAGRGARPPPGDEEPGPRGC